MDCVNNYCPNKCFNQELYNEIKLLRDEVHVLKKQLIEMKMYMGKNRFDKKMFLQSMTVDYLKTCNLDQETRDQLLNMCSRLDFPV